MGWPVMHSRSPVLHNYFFKHYGLAGTYVPLAIKPDDLEAALRALAPLGFAGCNLTIPHKERALAIVDEIDDLARRIGAISCVVVRPDGSLAGTNNDVHGFARNILQQQPAWRADAGPAVVIGAGGGARAVVYSLADRGAREIRVANRTRARAEALARDFGPSVTPIDWDDRHRALDGAAMLVNTTSQGMVGQPPLDLELARFRRAPWSPTSFMFRSKRRCLPRRATAATAPSTASGCCFTRRASPGSSGSDSSRRSRRSCAPPLKRRCRINRT